jgi:hypothetical protein
MVATFNIYSAFVTLGQRSKRSPRQKEAKRLALIPFFESTSAANRLMLAWS